MGRLMLGACTLVSAHSMRATRQGAQPDPPAGTPLLQVVKYRPPGGEERVRTLMQLSGGERRRIALALCLAFADLVRQHGRLSCNVLVLDEVRAHAWVWVCACVCACACLCACLCVCLCVCVHRRAWLSWARAPSGSVSRMSRQLLCAVRLGDQPRHNTAPTNTGNWVDPRQEQLNQEGRAACRQRNLGTPPIIKPGTPSCCGV